MEKHSQFLSFLGTNDYLPCNYCFGERKIENIKFIQTATLKLICDHFSSNDRITIFVTKEAEERNEEKLLNEFKLHKLPEPELIKIPSGKSEKELWELFEIVFESLIPNSEIIFDITHSFRYIPMLSIVLLNYASFVKEVNLSGIYYGALEALGTFKQVEKMPLEKRNVPIFDLSPLALIQKWSIAVENFLKAGNVSQIYNVVENIRESHFKGKTKKMTDEQVKNSRSFANNILEFLGDLQTNRSMKLYKAESAKNLLETIEKLNISSINSPSPLTPLVKINEKVRSVVVKFDTVSENITNLIVSVELCINYNLIQQGYTQLQELIITYLCNKFGFDYLEYEKNRQVVSSLLNVVASKIPEEKWHYPLTEVNKDKLKEILQDETFQKLSTCFSALTKYRNDINHSGFNKDAIKNPLQFKSHLSKIFEKVKPILMED